MDMSTLIKTEHDNWKKRMMVETCGTYVLMNMGMGFVAVSYTHLLCSKIPGFWRTTYVYFMWKMLSEMRKERNGDEYKEI